LTDALPTVPVPLLKPDPDAALDLGEAVRSVYQRGGYDRRVRHTRTPPARLTDLEHTWISERLQTGAGAASGLGPDA
jgi:hypothetical protein